MKLPLKKLKLILLFIATAVLSNAYAGNPVCTSKVLPATWTSLVNQKGVTVSAQSSVCEGQSMIFLKMENSSDRAVIVTWSLYGESAQTTKLEAFQKKTGECSSNAPADMIVALPAGADINNAVITVE